ITASSIAMRVDATVSVFGAAVTVTGQATISASNFTCDVSASVSGLFPYAGFEITGTMSLHINTANNEYWVAVSNATVNIFGISMTGGFKIGIDSSGFSINVPSNNALTLDFFSIVTFRVSGNLTWSSTSVSFNFTASVSAGFDFTDIGIDVGVSGSASITFGTSGFGGSFSGSADIYGEPIASIDGSLFISGSQVHLSFSA